MDSEVGITVTRVLQTVAGRMIFAQPNEVAEELRPAARGRLTS
jgi:hypothetical protein